MGSRHGLPPAQFCEGSAGEFDDDDDSYDMHGERREKASVAAPTRGKDGEGSSDGCEERAVEGHEVRRDGSCVCDGRSSRREGRKGGVLMIFHAVVI